MSLNLSTGGLWEDTDGDEEESAGEFEEEAGPAASPGAQGATEGDEAAEGEGSGGGQRAELVGFSDSEDEWGTPWPGNEDAAPPEAAVATGRKRPAVDAFGEGEGCAEGFEAGGCWGW